MNSTTLPEITWFERRTHMLGWRPFSRAMAGKVSIRHLLETRGRRKDGTASGSTWTLCRHSGGNGSLATKPPTRTFLGRGDRVGTARLGSGREHGHAAVMTPWRLGAFA